MAVQHILNRVKWAALLFASLFSGMVSAIPVGTSIFNFDFTTLLVGPPYAQITIESGFDGRDVGEAFAIDVFNDLNGQGGIDQSFGPLLCPGSCLAIGVNMLYDSPAGPSIRDGIFSVGYHITGGEMDLFLTAFAINSAGEFVSSPGTLVVVPEPATLALLGLGLAGLGFSRRKKS